MQIADAAIAAPWRERGQRHVYVPMMADAWVPTASVTMFKLQREGW